MRNNNLLYNYALKIIETFSQECLYDLVHSEEGIRSHATKLI